MARPALIIGVGGTGIEILTAIKKDLVEIHKGELPENVKLLCFDTAPPPNMGADDAAREKVTVDSARIGMVKLDEGTEFFSIGANTLALAQQIGQGQHMCMQWFPAQEFSNLPPNVYANYIGAGQIRSFGRLAFFMDMRDPMSKIRGNISGKVKELTGFVDQQNQLEIIIIGSFAGGTGAGVIVDMGAVTRKITEQALSAVGMQNYIVRGMFVGPSTFMAAGANNAQAMYARSFATWRELDRFMMGDTIFGQQALNFDDTNSTLHYRLAHRIFDVSYILDANRTQNPLTGVNKTLGMYPEIAQVISAIVDEQAGADYTSYVTVNLASGLARMTHKPYHSSFGSYTIKVPFYYQQELYNYELAEEVLNRLLAPVTNATGAITGMEDTNNRDSSTVFAPRDYHALPTIQNIVSTTLPPQISDTNKKQGSVRQVYVKQTAEQKAVNLLTAFTNIGSDDTAKVILSQLSPTINYQITHKVLPSADNHETPRVSFTRVINDSEAEIKRVVGEVRVDGTQSLGAYGSSLQQINTVQVQRYQNQLAAHVLYVLNGVDPDPIIAKSGKIGYLLTFFAGLKAELSAYLAFLNEVVLERATHQYYLRSSQNIVNKKRAFEQQKDKQCWITFWDDFTHPDARQAERDYLISAQMFIDQRKADILLEVMKGTISEFLSVVNSEKNKIEQWANALLLDEKCLYKVEKSDHAAVGIAYDNDKAADRVSKHLTGAGYKVETKAIGNVLAKHNWTRDANGNLQLLIDGKAMHSQNINDQTTMANKVLLHGATQTEFDTFQRPPSIAEQLINPNSPYPTAQSLAQYLNGKCEPHYVPSPANPATPNTMALYTRVDSTQTVDHANYFTQYKTSMAELILNLQGNPNQLVGSEDPYKLTVFRSDDLLPSNAFRIWEECRDAYINELTSNENQMNPEKMHIFPAEQAAARYELGIRKRTGNYRILNPQVVSLLVDKSRFEYFFMALAFDLIKKKADTTGALYWSYEMPGSPEVYLSMPAIAMPVATESRNVHWSFQLVNAFISGRDVRTSQTGNFIRFDELKAYIQKVRLAQGKDVTIANYERQKTSGVIAKIQEDIKTDRDLEQNPLLRALIDVELDDLVNVAHFILDENIKHTQEFFEAHQRG